MTVRRFAVFLISVILVATMGTGTSPAAADRGGDGGLPAEHSLRASVTDENFYFVMADRFENGNTANDQGGLGSDPMVSGFDPTRTGFYNGGDLTGLLKRIDYVQGLGTTSIWLTPSFKNKAVQPEDSSAGYHGYWITDFTQIDPHLGTNDDLRALVDAAHKRGMKVYFDIITNHTADVIGYQEGARQPYGSKDVEPYRAADGTTFDDRDYAGTDTFPALSAATSFPFTPVLDPSETDLKVPAWLNDVTLYHNRGDTTFAGENSQYGDFYGLDDLFTENPRVVNGMIDIYRTWIRDFGVDGFRIDTMKHVNANSGSSSGRRSSSTPISRASRNSSCSARSTTPRNRSPRSSAPRTRCKPYWTSRSRTPHAIRIAEPAHPSARVILRHRRLVHRCRFERVPDADVPR